jgi:hypothetical protein
MEHFCDNRPVRYCYLYFGFITSNGYLFALVVGCDDHVVSV